MRNAFLFLVFLGMTLPVMPQEIHSPAQIIKLMTDSKVSYNISSLDKTIDCVDQTENLVYHEYYRVTSDSGLFTYKFQLKDDAKPFFDKAEMFFGQHNLDSALHYYKKTLESDPAAYNVMTYIGQIYGTKGDLENAMSWYKKTISSNYIDYMAHWFLGDIYLKSGKPEEAANEIALAQVLNRNNPRIREQLNDILTKTRREVTDWCFNPQMELSKDSNGKVNLAMNERWLGYAMPKALWAYEPGYRESMGVPEGQYSTLEDRECLVSLLVSLENAKVNIKKDYQLVILKRAAERNLLNEYILYEIILPKQPFIASQLSEKDLLSIKDYVLNCRYSKQ